MQVSQDMQQTLTVPTRTIPTPPNMLRVEIEHELNDYGMPLRWMITWLVARDTEGEIVAAGRGEGHVETNVRASVAGYRLRRWTSDGIAPEYEDTLFRPA